MGKPGQPILTATGKTCWVGTTNWSFVVVISPLPAKPKGTIV